MKKVYAAGPLLGCSDVEALGWRHEMKQLLGAQYVNDPADRYWVKDEQDLTPDQDRELVDGDLCMIDASDAVIWHAWKPSFGSSMEGMYAHMTGKLLIVVAANVRSAWVRRFADFRTDSLAEACRWAANQLGLEGCPCQK